MMKIKRYSELRKLKSFEDRFGYLKLSGRIGLESFGSERYLNQMLYKSKRWREVRDIIIIRDEGCDLGCLDYQINDILVIHHINPITLEDIEEDNPDIFNPEFLITTSILTHRAIHYGDESLLSKPLVIRYSGDTVPWR